MGKRDRGGERRWDKSCQLALRRGAKPERGGIEKDASDFSRGARWKDRFRKTVLELDYATGCHFCNRNDPDLIRFQWPRKYSFTAANAKYRVCSDTRDRTETP